MECPICKNQSKGNRLHSSPDTYSILIRGLCQRCYHQTLIATFYKTRQELKRNITKGAEHDNTKIV